MSSNEEHKVDRLPSLCPYAQSIDCYDLETRNPYLIAQGCRRWSCPACAPRRKAQLAREIVRGKPSRMITLTSKHSGWPKLQLEIIRRALPRLVKVIRDQVGEFEYVRMLETCKDGYPHFHLLARSKFIHKNFVRHHWRRLTGAYVVDLRRAHGKSVGYVAKYIGKACDATGTMTRQRMSISKSFLPLRDDDAASRFFAFTHEREHPIAHVERNHAFVAAERFGLYQYCYREPGDELPFELTRESLNASVPASLDKSTHQSIPASFA